MAEYYGDFDEDATVYILFNTFDSNDPSASVTITNLADADIKVHKDGGTTEIATDGATIAINFDGVTGQHLITIDTSVHADYATGSDYMVRIEGTTVDAATINAWVGIFSIENRHSATANAAIQSTVDAIPTTAMRGTDGANTVVPDAAGVAPTAVENRQEMDANSVDLNTIQSNQTTINTNVLQNGTDIGALNNFDPAADTVANVTLTATTTTLTNKTGFSLAATGLDAIVSTATGMVEIAKAVWDRIISKANHDIGQSSGKILRQSGDLVQIDGAVSDVSPTVGGFDTTLTQVDNYFNDATLTFSNGAANAGIGFPVSLYVNANGHVTFDAPDQLPVTPVNGDDFVIVAFHTHPVGQIADAVADEPLAGHTTAGTLGKAVSDTDSKTAQMTFTKANEMDSNIQSVNDVTVTGTGASGDEWGPL